MIELSWNVEFNGALTICRETEPPIRLDIRKEPIKEEDDKAQSALSNVANTLRAVSP